MSANIQRQGSDCSTSSASDSSPEQRSESRGSSVSAGLREEYEDILKYAVVAPKLLGESSTLTAPLPTTPPTERQRFEEDSSPSLPSQLPSPPHPTSPPPHPSLGHLSHSPSPPPSPPTQFTMAQHSSGPPPPQLPPHPDTHSDGTAHQSHDIPHMSHDIPHMSRDQSKSDVGMDPEVARLGMKLDTWCIDLKRNVLAEFEQARIRVMENKQRELEGQMQQQAYALHQVQEELERYKELVATFETSVARKDQIVASLTGSLEKQKSRVELQKSFSAWKIKHHDDQREAFTSALAQRHSHRRIMLRVWEVWFGVIRERWRQRVERACQTKAEEVCVKLTTDYDERLAVSQRALDEAHHEIQQLKAEKTQYEQNMKQAFMRGVCALNMEAISMFRQSNGAGNHDDLAPPTGDSGEDQSGEEENVENTPSVDLPHPPPLTSSHSAPSTYHQLHPTCSTQPPLTSQQAHSVLNPFPTVQSGHVTTSAVRIQTSQTKVRGSTRGQSLVGMGNCRKGCGQPKPRPVVMVERHTLE